VVTRGTGANYGEDGFLRPGFKYGEGIKYLHSKLTEHLESEQVDLLCLISHAFFRTSPCVLRTHLESRFFNPHVVILLN
jgi:hypothetical protein